MRWAKRMTAWAFSVFFGKFGPPPAPPGGATLSEAQAALERARQAEASLDQAAAEARRTSAGFRALRNRGLSSDITESFRPGGHH